MKRITLFFLVLSLGTPALAYDINVTIWNIFHANKISHKHKREDEDWAALQKYATRLGSSSDVLMLQEVESADIAEFLFGSDFQWFVSTRAPGSQRDADLIRTVTGVRKSALDVLQSFVYHDISRPHNGRYGVDVTVQVPNSTKSLRLLNIDLDGACKAKDFESFKTDFSCDNSRNELRSLHAWTADRETEGASFLIGGTTHVDLLNTFSTLPLFRNNPGYQVLNTGTPNCWRARFPTWSDFFVASTKAASLFVSGSFRETTYKGGVTYKEYADKISDHCPISVTFSL